MGKVLKRWEVLEKLHATLDKDMPVIITGASCGLVGKCAERSDTDLILYSTMGRSRFQGFPTRIIGDFSGNISMQMQRDLWMVVKHTPLIAGLDASDIECLDLDRLVDRFVDAGVSGFCNLPTVQFYGTEFRTRASGTYTAFENELALIEKCRKRDLFGIGFVFFPEDALKMIDAGADCIIANCGATEGGMSGYGHMEYDVAVERIEKIVKVVKKANPDVICIGHGGPFNSPESTRILYDRTGVDGYYGGSSIERIPVENAVREIVEQYKAPVLSALCGEKII